jgi:outer membrane usher protein
VVNQNEKLPRAHGCGFPLCPTIRNPGWGTTVLLSQQRIDFNVPQVAVMHHPRGYVPESNGNRALPQGCLTIISPGKNRSAARRRSDVQPVCEPAAGLNVGPWRLRNYSTLNHNDDGNQWDSVYSYISRDIHALKGQLIWVRPISSSSVFDSISFTGLQLNSDKEMLPDSMNGFAPVIKGIARRPPT